MRFVIVLPLLLLLALFALSNPEYVRLGLWPTDFAVSVPLSLAVLAAMAVAFLLGGVVVWAGNLGLRRRARRAEQVARALEAEIADLRARLPRAPLPPPSA